MATQIINDASTSLVVPYNNPAWNDYVDAHPQGTIFHRAEMVSTFQATPHYKPFALAATDESGKIVALIVAARVITVEGFVSRWASRSIFFASPLCDDTETGVRALTQLLRIHDEQLGSHVIFAEVRPSFPVAAEHEALLNCRYKLKDYDNYVVNLQRDTAALWQGVSRSHRRGIRRSFERGVSVVHCTTHDTIDKMFELLRLSYHRSQVPLSDVRLFHAALDLLPRDCVQVRLAWYNGEPVASGIALVYKGIVFAWYGGTRRLRTLSPFGCLTWDQIRWGSENGQRLYDFGGAGWTNKPYGPREFKSRFGGELVQYGRYRKVFSSWRMAVAKAAFEVSRKFISPAEE